MLLPPPPLMPPIMDHQDLTDDAVSIGWWRAYAQQDHANDAEVRSWKNVLTAMVMRGANPNARDTMPGYEGFTPLHYLLAGDQLQGKGTLSRRTLQEMRVNHLLALGADPTLTTDDGCTALHIALARPNWVSVALLERLTTALPGALDIPGPTSHIPLSPLARLRQDGAYLTSSASTLPSPEQNHFHLLLLNAERIGEVQRLTLAMESSNPNPQEPRARPRI